MNPDSENPMPARFPDQRPPIECFAAFLDGELSADNWARVQDWLANHPEDAALVQAHRNLLRCWQETAPVEPSEEVWREVLARIESGGLGVEDRNIRAGVDCRTSILDSRSSLSQRGRWIRVGLLGAAAAAAVILAMIVPHREPTDAVVKTSTNPPVDTSRGRQEPNVDEALAILTTDDVDLVSMEGNDMRLLVVGNPPVHEPLVLVATGDVILDSIEPDEDGFVPHVRMNPGSSAAPMIIAPLRGSETKDSSGK